MTNAEMLGLLREARECVICPFAYRQTMYCACTFCALKNRIGAALSESSDSMTGDAAPEKLVFTRNGPFLEDQHGGKWWNETLLTLTQSDKANVAKVERIIVANARAENDLTQALAESRKLRSALELAAVEVSSQRTYCILCRTEYRGDEPSRVEHPHDRACALHERSAR